MSTKNQIDTSQWVDQYSDALFGYAYYRLNDRELAYDYVQETFYSALKALDRFEQKSSVKTWLFSILKRKIIDYWRQQEARKTKAVSKIVSNQDQDTSWVEYVTAKNDRPEVEIEIENSELRSALMSCISGLPEKWKAVFVDKYIDEKDSEEICNEHNITSSNFWVIIHRAKARLQGCMKENWLNN
mgnify:CR=1 FL=1